MPRTICMRNYERNFLFVDKTADLIFKDIKIAILINVYVGVVKISQIAQMLKTCFTT